MVVGGAFSLALMLPFLLPSVNWMFRGNSRGPSRPREWRKHVRAAQDTGRETALKEGDGICVGDSKRPINFLSASGMAD